MPSVKIKPFSEKSPLEAGFTLLELGIVLMIIGLLTGGVFVGLHLLEAATIRAQITQINKYNTATHLFETKYGYLPGDIPNPYATNFGFIARGTYAGQGDGNGVLESDCGSNGNNDGREQGCGELAVFWVDLTTAGLLDVNIVSIGGYPNEITASFTTTINQWLPPAKLGGQNSFVYLYSINMTNYFAVSTVDTIAWNIGSLYNPGITAYQAYILDSKIDDGLPQSGDVTACYSNYRVVSNQVVWAAGSQTQGATGGTNCVPTTTATPYLNTNCYDNNNSAGPQQYSIVKNSNLPNCALSFRFQ